MRELIENAGIFAWPLAICSLLATIIIIERLFALRKSRIIPGFYEIAFSTGSIPEHGDEGSVAGRILDYYHQGKLDGITRIYNQDGTLLAEKKYRDGTLIEQ